MGIVSIVLMLIGLKLFVNMKGRVRLKIITVFLMVAGVNCGDFIDELKSAMDKFCDKMDKLQDTVDKISLEQIKTNKKVDHLEEKIEKLEAEMKTFTLGIGCKEAETDGA